jgi:hypothetical protein
VTSTTVPEKGMRCPDPDCGSEEQFYIEVTAVAVVCDGAIDGLAVAEWSDDSYAECPACGWHGIAADLYARDDRSL